MKNKENNHCGIENSRNSKTAIIIKQASVSSKVRKEEMWA